MGNLLRYLGRPNYSGFYGSVQSARMANTRDGHGRGGALGCDYTGSQAAGEPAGRVVRFRTIDCTLTLNELLRTRWRKCRIHFRVIAGQVHLAIAGQRSTSRDVRALLRVERRSISLPDSVELVGGLKGLLDAVLPPGRAYQTGLRQCPQATVKAIRVHPVRSQQRMGAASCWTALCSANGPIVALCGYRVALSKV